MKLDGSILETHQQRNKKDAVCAQKQNDADKKRVID